MPRIEATSPHLQVVRVADPRELESWLALSLPESAL
jgi:hypothetical protein